MTEARDDGANPVAEQFEDIGQQEHADLLGMWLFLATEAMFFGGLFLGFAVYRHAYPEAFAAAAGRLDLVLGGLNTAILLTSGVTMAMVEPAMVQRARRRVIGLLSATIGLGLLFLAVKASEYVKEFGEGLAPFAGFAFVFDGPRPDRAEIFYSFYFALTGLHALHMIVGLAVLAVMIVLTRRWAEPHRLGRQLRLAGLYWAFVDAVWLLVFPTLYLLGSAPR